MFGPLGLKDYGSATLQNLILSFPWIAPGWTVGDQILLSGNTALHPGAVLGIKLPPSIPPFLRSFEQSLLPSPVVPVFHPVTLRVRQTDHWDTEGVA